MTLRRKLAVLFGVAFTGLVFGALAGAAAVAALFLAIAVRMGRIEFGGMIFGSLVGGVIGGPLGAMLAPLAGFTSLRHVPLGRLFAQLTAGTILGGCAAALLTANPILALGGGLFGFLIAAARLAERGRAEVVSPE